MIDLEHVKEHSKRAKEWHCKDPESPEAVVSLVMAMDALIDAIEEHQAPQVKLQRSWDELKATVTNLLAPTEKKNENGEN